MITSCQSAARRQRAAAARCCALQRARLAIVCRARLALPVRCGALPVRHLQAEVHGRAQTRNQQVAVVGLNFVVERLGAERLDPSPVHRQPLCQNAVAEVLAHCKQLGHEALPVRK